MMRAVLQDGRFTFRLWARHPLHPVFMIAALAISLSAAAAFTIWFATRRIPELDIMRMLRAE